jgi:hypothetical protein
MRFKEKSMRCPEWADTAATLPSNPSPLSEAGGRVLQFCRLLGCLDAEEVAAYN